MIRAYGLAALVVAADQAAKLACSRLAAPVTLLEGVLRLTCVHNTGMAFSLLSGHPWLLGVISALCIAAGVAALHRYRPGPLGRTGLALMLGGAAGNMIDRLLRGYVIDMFEVLFVRFAVFNVADAALTVGTVLLAASLLCRPEDWSVKNGST